MPDREITLHVALRENCSQIVRLHRSNIEGGFLSSLGASFLKVLYQTMTTSKKAFCIVAEDEGRVVGFVSAAMDTRGLYKEFLKKHFFRASIMLLPKVFNYRALKRILETLLYPVKKMSNLPETELLSIATDEGHQHKGIGSQLFMSLVEDLKKRGVNQFKVIVGSNLLPACRFYEKMGGIVTSEIEIHKGEKSKVYVWQI